MPRTVKSTYQDPVEIVWRHAALRCGIEIVRSANVFASWDGKKILQIGTAETLDPDDSLAQMVLHELCHAMVAGPDGMGEMDWGLDYDCPTHQVYEHAALRLQATLADEVGMRQFFASTTDFRTYFDQLPAHPLSDQSLGADGEIESDPAASLARDGLAYGEQLGWLAPVRAALKRTQAIAKLLRPIAEEDSLWKQA